MIIINPLLILISSVISFISTAVLVWVVMSLLIQFDIINRYNPLVAKVFKVLEQLMKPMLRPIQRFIPPIAGIDFSPLILILLLNFVNNVIAQVLRSF
jgi:YggT family protein